MKIRKFRKGDEKTCSPMLIESFSWYFEFKGSEWLKKKFSAASIAREAKQGINLVAVDSGNIIGYCHATISDYGVAYLSTIGVSKRIESRGIGSALLEKLETICRTIGVRKIWLMVTHTNTVAISFYRRHGYRKEGMLKDMTLEGVHEIIMSKHF